MLKLKYLFNNVDLVEMLLKNWGVDEESPELFKYYRISSNAIYPFQADGTIQFLRFSPQSEKSHENLLAELDFISYLNYKDYRALESVPSKKSEFIVKAQTPWGDYFVSVFKRVPGHQISETDLNDTIIYNYGKALGRLHVLSSSYQPNSHHKRWSHREVFGWMEHVLKKFPSEINALIEIDLLKTYFNSILKTPSNYGLVHFDFECDNVFYDEATASCHVIDFDDAIYHWYAMDLEQALDSLQDNLPLEQFESKKLLFLEGYRSQFELTDDTLSLLPACRRFADLYSYVRLLLASAEQWANEPYWLMNLRDKLQKSMTNKALKFGSKL